MKSHATPGPWHVSDPESCNEVIDSMGRTIAVVEEWDSTGRGNVTLLAAAHDLLETLEEIECVFRHYRPSNLREELPAIYANLKSVINKAKADNNADR